jgi:hypothetical protein
MTIESVLNTKTRVTFVEARPYSYVTTPLDLINKIFEVPELDSIKLISNKLLSSAIEPELLTKEITIGAEAFKDCNACISRLLRETRFGITDNKQWTIFQNLLLNSYKPQEMLMQLNKSGIIDDNTDPWGLLRILEKHNSKED